MCIRDRARAAVLSMANSVVPTMATHGSPRQLPRQCPRTSNHSNFHGHPRPLPRLSSDTRQLPRKSAEIATSTAISTAICGHCHGNPPICGNYDASPRQLPRQFPQTSNHSNFHGHPRQSSDTRQLPRKFTAIATAISTAFRGHPRQLNSHVNRRQFPCNHGSCNGHPR